MSFLKPVFLTIRRETTVVVKLQLKKKVEANAVDIEISKDKNLIRKKKTRSLKILRTQLYSK